MNPLVSIDDVLKAERKVNGRIDELAAESSMDGWDSEGGRLISAAQWDDARSIASRVIREVLSAPVPFVSACGDGTAHLQWTSAGGDRWVVEIGPARYWWSYLSRTGESDEVSELRSPDEAIARIRALFG